jgi:hypothetical protein
VLTLCIHCIAAFLSQLPSTYFLFFWPSLALHLHGTIKKSFVSHQRPPASALADSAGNAERTPDGGAAFLVVVLDYLLVCSFVFPSPVHHQCMQNDVVYIATVCLALHSFFFPELCVWCLFVCATPLVVLQTLSAEVK